MQLEIGTIIAGDEQGNSLDTKIGNAVVTLDAINKVRTVMICSTNPRLHGVDFKLFADAPIKVENIKKGSLFASDPARDCIINQVADNEIYCGISSSQSNPDNIGTFTLLHINYVESDEPYIRIWIE